MKFHRNVIRIRGEDSPNVRLALDQQARGKEPTGEVVVPGVLSWDDYQHRRATWDRVRQCVGLDAEFYEGADLLLFPPEWINRAESVAAGLQGKVRRARAVGIDTAEGGDDTSLAAVDEYGLIELESHKTPDTNVVHGLALAFMRKWNVPDEKVYFDRGGGGKQHADRLRAEGYNVKTVGFGESLLPDLRRGITVFPEKVEHREERFVYVNRRAEIYHKIRLLIDPSNEGWGIPAEYQELRRQMAPVPLTYDDKGRIWLLPKHVKDPAKNKDDQRTLVGLIGRSPDDLEAVALAVYGMSHRVTRATAGVA